MINDCVGGSQYVGVTIRTDSPLSGFTTTTTTTSSTSTTTTSATTSSSTTTAPGTTIEFTDGFDHLAVGHFKEKWDSDSGEPTSLIPGRVEGNAVRFQNNSGVLKFTMSSAQSTWSKCFAFRVSAFGTQTVIAQLLDGTSSQLELVLLANGTMAITRNGTQLGVTSQPIAANTWQFLEWSIVIATTLGQIHLRVMETMVISVVGSSGTPLNTRGSVGNITANVMKLGPLTPGTGIPYDYDDFVLARGLYFPGQIRVQARRTVANGPAQDWTRVGAPTNWQAVNENPPDYDTSFVQAGSVGNTDTYQMEDVTLNNVIAVQVCVLSRRDSSAPRSVAPVASNSAGSTVVPGTSTPCQASFRVARSILMKNPVTNSDWTGAAEVNGLRFGQKVSA